MRGVHPMERENADLKAENQSLQFKVDTLTEYVQKLEAEVEDLMSDLHQARQS